MKLYSVLLKLFNSSLASDDGGSIGSGGKVKDRIIDEKTVELEYEEGKIIACLETRRQPVIRSLVPYFT